MKIKTKRRKISSYGHLMTIDALQALGVKEQWVISKLKIKVISRDRSEMHIHGELYMFAAACVFEIIVLKV